MRKFFFLLKFQSKRMIFHWRNSWETFLSHYYVIYVLKATKYSKTTVFFTKFPFLCAQFYICTEVVLHKNFFILSIFKTSHWKIFFSYSFFLLIRSVKNYSDTYSNKLLNQCWSFWGNKNQRAHFWVCQVWGHQVLRSNIEKHRSSS